MIMLALPYNPWLYLLIFIAVLGGGIFLLSLIISLAVARAAAKYSDKVIGKYQEQIEKMLPGTNCRKCKCATCSDFADAVLHTETDEERCPYIDDETRDKMVALREKLHKLMEDPTPPEKKEPRFWERKF